MKNTNNSITKLNESNTRNCFDDDILIEIDSNQLFESFYQKKKKRRNKQYSFNEQDTKFIKPDNKTLNEDDGNEFVAISKLN